MSTIALIDAKNVLYRAHYSQPAEMNSAGFPVSAIRGFVHTMRQVFRELKPEYILVAMDSEKSFRKELCATYKANRQETPSELTEQFSILETICGMLGFAFLCVENHEADDVIGVVARRAQTEGFDAIKIVSNDKDFAQIMDERTRMVSFSSDGVGYYTDIHLVWDKYGVRPDQFVDYLGLCGDAADGICGAPGIGTKRATALLQQFGTLENILFLSDEIKAKGVRESIQNNRELILESRELARIASELPTEFSLEDFRYIGPERETCFEVFNRLELYDFAEKFRRVA
jgi:DNA polymerase I